MAITHERVALAPISRRTAIESLLAGSVAALTLTRGGGSGLAQGTPAVATGGMPPNAFTLAGEDTKISFSTTSLTGQPIFSYTGPDAEVSAEGDDIQMLPVATGGWPFGTLVSAYVDAAPDAWARSVTLVLPGINLIDGEETEFTTFAMLTTHFTNIGGPKFVQGPLQEYEIIPLEGSANFLMF